MKKKLRCYLTLLLPLGLLAACSTHSQNSTNQSSSSTTVSSSVKKSTSSSEISTSSTVSSKSEEAPSTESSSSTEVTLAPINTGAIVKADYSIMAGTWQNAASGETLTFDDAGLATAGLTVDFLDIDQNGILLLDVQTGSKTNVTLYIVPANTSFSSDYLNGQSDNSEVSKYRIISSADISSGDIANKAYYHVSE